MFHFSTFLSLLTIAGMAVGSEASTANTTQSSTSVYLPIIGSQSLVASLSAATADIKTLIVQCPTGVTSVACGFPTPVTVTAGPSTVALTTVVKNELTLDLRCEIEGSTKASCTQTYTGPASLHSQMSNGQDGAKTETWTATTVLQGSQVTYCPVAITAGATTNAANEAGNAATAVMKSLVVAAFVHQLIVAIL